jgi:hypothetical protein
MGWYYYEHDYRDVYSFPHHPDVKSSASQFWQHTQGLEYLAANPLFVPALDPILRSIVVSDSTFNSQVGAFVATEAVPARVSKDILNTLPEELRLEVLAYLPSKDIANLRLASHTFRQLPVLLWRRLIREEMPWLWEVWTEDEPFKWATVSFDQLKQDATEKQVLEEELASMRAIVEQELPELVEAWEESERALIPIRPDVQVESHAQVLRSMAWKLPPRKINWFALYTLITRQWKDLKGLHNRARIWKAVEEIIRRIKKYRTEGKILG